MPQLSGMQGTGSFTAERPGDFGQKIKDLARRKRAKGTRAIASSSARGFQEPGQPLDMPVPNGLTYDIV